MMMNKQYIVPLTEIMDLGGEMLMDNLASISNKNEPTNLPAPRRDLVF